MDSPTHPQPPTRATTWWNIPWTTCGTAWARPGSGPDIASGRSGGSSPGIPSAPGGSGGFTAPGQGGIIGFDQTGGGTPGTPGSTGIPGTPGTPTHTLGRAGVEAIRSVYDAETEPADFIRRFEYAYRASLEGRTLTPAELSEVQHLSEPQIRAAVEAAQEDLQMGYDGGEESGSVKETWGEGVTEGDKEGSLNELKQNAQFKWGNSKSRPTYGHTFTEHGQKQTLMQLFDRARSLGHQVGQWVDDKVAADFLATVATRGKGVYDIKLPPDVQGRCFCPNGTVINADMARVVVKIDGSIRTAYPYNSQIN